MAASLSRPDPSSPASVAEAGFTTARRGFNQDEVRAFLVAVAAELGRLQERERQLTGELDELRRSRPAAVELDDDTVAEVLGEETLRVLQTARESASQIKIRAEESAAQTLREASEEANRLRQDAEVEAARKRHDAASDAEAEVALAKQQGREMVSEARAYRERVLADLERRTKLARNQIEELLHGRDRLLQVFERARLVAVDVTSELKAVEGPDELVNLTPTTGPVPIMVPTTDEPGRGEVADLAEATGDDAETAVAEDAETDGVAAAEDTETDDVDLADGDAGADVDAGAGADVDADADVEVEVDDEHDEGDDEEGTVSDRDGNVVSLFRGRAPDAAAGDAGDDARPDVEGLFERLRSETAGEAAATDEDVDADRETPTFEASTDGHGTSDETEAAEAVADGSETPDESTADQPVEPTAFTRRDEAIVPLIVAGARKLKRVLADEQNLVLDALRQQEPVASLDDLLPELDVHLASYAEALDDEMLGAAAAGAGELGMNDTKTLRRKLTKAGALDRATTLLRTDLVVPLRDRLERAVAEGGGDNDAVTKRVRAVYREWKTQHIDDQLDDVVRFAHGGGLATMADPGSPMVWTIDPSEPACPDCEDNSLAGPVAAGDPYPTGHSSAPAHTGCRCLTVPAGQ